MWAIVTNGSVNAIRQQVPSINGVQHPKNIFNIWSKEELKEKTDAVMEAMFLSNVMIIQKWSMQFEDYDINNDEEEDNQDFRGQYLNRNKP